MKFVSIIAAAIFLVSCVTSHNSSQVAAGTAQEQSARTPSATSDLTGTFLGEGLYSNRTTGLRRPAMRIYLDRVQGESNSYHAVLVEYDQLLNMGLPYIAAQKAPALNKVIGYLDKIATRISAYKLIPSQKSGTYQMHNLEVRNGQIVPVLAPSMHLILDPANKESNPLAGATISGNPEGPISFPSESDEQMGSLKNLVDVLNISQYKLAAVIYKKAHLGSSWRGNWNDLEGSYLSEYGRFTDGVLELYSVNGQKRHKFIKTNTTKAKYFTNPKSAAIEGEYLTTEPIPKMYILTSANKVKTASDKEMTGRIGVFLDVFDASAPEAGGHMVTELAHINPQDPEDFMMYYEHPQHLKNVGVEPKK
ncbi:hypothetical protein [Bdellovibrio sp. HCB337]|uniref:hypothetical protein n=1 Tax=Bdellovibrio sp. HCB337 TaxID=3394358 RepID=UPI0039A50395